MKPEVHYRQIDYQERQTIAFGVEQGQSMRAIGRLLGRSPSTISREIERSAPGNPYSCRCAQKCFERRRRFGRPGPKPVLNNALFDSITELLLQHWSPQQVAAHLAKLHPHEAAMRASHETTKRGAAPRAHCLLASGAGVSSATTRTSSRSWDWDPTRDEAGAGFTITPPRASRPMAS